VRIGVSLCPIIEFCAGTIQCRGLQEVLCFSCCYPCVCLSAFWLMCLLVCLDVDMSSVPRFSSLRQRSIKLSGLTGKSSGKGDQINTRTSDNTWDTSSTVSTVCSLLSALCSLLSALSSPFFFRVSKLLQKRSAELLRLPRFDEEMMDGFQIVKYQQGERTPALYSVCDVDTLLNFEFFSLGLVGLIGLHLFTFLTGQGYNSHHDYFPVNSGTPRIMYFTLVSTKICCTHIGSDIHART
jgi:hypothetical protein